MRVLLDNNVNRRFSTLLTGHEVVHVQDVGWDKLRNGELLKAADRAGYAVLITCDKNLAFQQNLAGKEISVLVLHSLFLKLEHVAALSPQVQRILDVGTSPGEVVSIFPQE